MEEHWDKVVDIEPRTHHDWINGNLSETFEEEYNIIDARPDLTSPANVEEADLEDEGIRKKAQQSLVTGVIDGSLSSLLGEEPTSTGEPGAVERTGVVDE
jgi:hypothetical protein